MLVSRLQSAHFEEDAQADDFSNQTSSARLLLDFSLQAQRRSKSRDDRPDRGKPHIFRHRKCLASSTVTNRILLVGDLGFLQLP
jgi:hypothetical protein